MDKKRFLSLCLGLLTCLALVLGLAARARANLGAFEAPLNPLGRAYEINPDAAGRLWISEYEAGEIWRVNPDTDEYQVFPVGGSPFDAHHDATNQFLWWVDGAQSLVGRVATATGDYTHWQVPDNVAFNGMALDASGRLWAMGFESPRLYRLDADQGQLCTYVLSLSARANYVLHAGGYLWLGDTYNERLLRLTVSDNSLRSWTLPEFSSPYGMTLDGQGNLWYADASNNVLARLNPTTNQLAVFELPTGATPQMITYHKGLIWYTAQASLGYLDPQIATPTDPPFVPTVANATLTPSCSSISPIESDVLTMTSGTLAWSPASYTPLQEANGWWIYQLPTNAAPYGITGTSSIWFVDTGRRVLGKVPTASQVTACKLQDLDQNPLSTGDRIPVPGWTLYLTIGGVRQTPGQVTGPDGCTTWSDLASGLEYGLEEDLLPEWQALTPTSYSFGIVGPLAQLSHTFINGREMESLHLPLVVR